jgi:N utilization substance protein A
VVEVKINEEEKAATVVVPDKQLSLAIGKEGQNARLAAKLTGWRIDIRSLSMTEVEKEAVVEEVAPEGEPPISEGAPELVAAGSDLIPPDLEIELEAPPAPSEAEPLATTGEILSALDRSIAKISAEDLALKQLKPEDRAKKGKKKASPKRAVLENEEYETG